MRVRIKFLYFALVVLLAINALLLAGLFLIKERKVPKEMPRKVAKSQVKPQKPKVIFEDNYEGLEISLDNEKLFNLLQESGFLQGYLAVNLTTLESYNPKQIIIAIHSQKDFQSLPLLQRFKVGKVVTDGYGVSQTDEIYRLDFYFNPDYIATLTGEDLQYAFNSALVKAITRLAALHRKKVRLTKEEDRQVLKQAVSYLDKFTPLYVKAK